MSGNAEEVREQARMEKREMQRGAERRAKIIKNLRGQECKNVCCRESQRDPC